MAPTHSPLTRPRLHDAVAAALGLLVVFAAAPAARAQEKSEKTAPARSIASRSSPANVRPLINEVVWAPKDTVIRRAKGGDNWPLTWGDDDALYSAYGDGNGFEPFIPQKLSLGLVKITGAPPDFQGVNIRSASAEATGNDVRGHKASGMLMVDSVLYMLVR